MPKQLNHLTNKLGTADNANYLAVENALASKPIQLAAILAHTSQSFDLQLKSDLASTNKIKASIDLELKRAEKQYQKTIKLMMEDAFASYQQLSITEKIDLLAYSEHIAQINEKIRQNAREHMQQTLAMLKEWRAKQTEEKHHTLAATLKPVEPKPVISKHHTPTVPAINTSAKQVPNSNLQQPVPIPDDKPLINEVGLGSPAAFTLNLPFTHIPGLPALNQVLQKIDRSTHMDLGFTLKGMVDSVSNSKGEKDLVYKLNYAGFGVMSSKVNAQFAPIALKLEDSQDEATWGSNTSVFTRIHSEKLGSKFSLNINDSDAGLSYAHEASYQQPSKKFISTATAGRYLGKDAVVIRVPSDYVPTLKRISDALPNGEETKVILDRIDKVIPVSQAYEIATNTLENAAALGSLAVGKAQKLVHQFKEDGLHEYQQHTTLNRMFENHHQPSLLKQPQGDYAQDLAQHR